MFVIVWYVSTVYADADQWVSRYEPECPPASVYEAGVVPEEDQPVGDEVPVPFSSNPGLVTLGVLVVAAWAGTAAATVPAAASESATAARSIRCNSRGPAALEALPVDRPIIRRALGGPAYG